MFYYILALIIGASIGASFVGFWSYKYMDNNYKYYGNLIKAKDSDGLYFMLEVGDDIYKTHDGDLVVLKVKEKRLTDIPRDSQRLK